MGGLLYIVEQFPVGVLYLGPSSKDISLERELIDLCHIRGVPVSRIGEGDVIDIKGARVEVLHSAPDWRPGASENDHSLTFRVDWPGPRVAFCTSALVNVCASPENFMLVCFIIALS